MTIHCFANIITPYGTAANNRGESQGSTTTLQKLLWHGRTHSTVSAEAIRFALRRRLEAAAAKSCNRTYNEDTRANEWQDHEFKGWAGKGDIFADDDLLGFMKAEAAKDEKDAEGGKAKGTTTARRAVLELTRAVSLTPWAGDVMFNAASPGATTSAAKKGANNPVPYVVEVHATRYQYGLAMTPARLKDPSRAKVAIESLCALGEVAGNHARFLYDFSPDSVVFRVTDDPAPRLLYCFEERDGAVVFPQLVARVGAGDIKASELIIGGAIVSTLTDADKTILIGATLLPGVRTAAVAVCRKLG
jgi:CRISPR-associated protein Cst2